MAVNVNIVSVPMYFANEVTAAAIPVVGNGNEASVIFIAAGAAGKAFVKAIVFATVLQPLAFCACTVILPTAPIPEVTFKKLTVKTLSV